MHSPNLPLTVSGKCLAFFHPYGFVQTVASKCVRGDGFPLRKIIMNYVFMSQVTATLSGKVIFKSVW